MIQAEMGDRLGPRIQQSKEAARGANCFLLQYG